MTAFLLQILRMSLWGSVLAAMILLVKRLLGERLPAVFHYAVWGILLLRLALPFSVSYARPLAVEVSAQPPFTRKASETIKKSLYPLPMTPVSPVRADKKNGREYETRTHPNVKYKPKTFSNF